MTDAELLELAAGLAQRAAAAILEVRRAGFAVERKSDRTPVTEADRIAEALIVEGLRAATPGIPVIAEEEVAAGLVTALAERFWLVDPLDGTREFAKGTDHFAVCIGLVVRDQPRLGAVALPATDELYGGVVGTGAWKQAGAGPRQTIKVRAVPPEGLTVMASAHHADDPRLLPFLAGRKVAQVQNVGSAWKFCRVAEGTADVYPRFHSMMEWDTAGPQALVEAAGGSVELLDGGPLRYGKPGFTNPPFLCRGLA